MPYGVWLHDQLIAVIDTKNHKLVIDGKRAPLIEPCLMAYGISVNFGQEESVVYQTRLEGYGLNISSDMDEGRIAEAVAICVALLSATRPEVEKLDEKIYAVELKREAEERGEKHEVEFEKA